MIFVDVFFGILKFVGEINVCNLSNIGFVFFIVDIIIEFVIFFGFLEIKILDGLLSFINFKFFILNILSLLVELN